jgi:hypothetical protein
MFILKTKGGLVGSKRQSSMSKSSTLLPRKIQKILYLKPKQIVKPSEERLEEAEVKEYTKPP